MIFNSNFLEKEGELGTLVRRTSPFGESGVESEPEEGSELEKALLVDDEGMFETKPLKVIPLTESCNNSNLACNFSNNLILRLSPFSLEHKPVKLVKIKSGKCRLEVEFGKCN